AAGAGRTAANASEATAAADKVIMRKGIGSSRFLMKRQRKRRLRPAGAGSMRRTGRTRMPKGCGEPSARERLEFDERQTDPWITASLVLTQRCVIYPNF